MIIHFFRWLIGYNWEWVEHHRERFQNGTLFLFICKKTGRIKKIWVGD